MNPTPTMVHNDSNQRPAGERANAFATAAYTADDDAFIRSPLASLRIADTSNSHSAPATIGDTLQHTDDAGWWTPQPTTAPRCHNSTSTAVLRDNTSADQMEGSGSPYKTQRDDASSLGQAAGNGAEDSTMMIASPSTSTASWSYLVGNAPLLPSSPDFSPPSYDTSFASTTAAANSGMDENYHRTSGRHHRTYRYRPPPCFSPDILQVPMVPLPMVGHRRDCAASTEALSVASLAAGVFPLSRPPCLTVDESGVTNTMTKVAAVTTAPSSTPLLKFGHHGLSEPPASLDQGLPWAKDAPSSAILEERPSTTLPHLPLMATPELTARSTISCLQVALEMRRETATTGNGSFPFAPFVDEKRS